MNRDPPGLRPELRVREESQVDVSCPNCQRAFGPTSWLLDYQEILQVQRGVDTVVLDLFSGVVVQRIEPETVLGVLDDREESVSKENPLLGAYQAFEDRLLYSQAVVFAGYGNPTESPPAFRGRRGDIVGDENQHGSSNPTRLQNSQRTTHGR